MTRVAVERPHPIGRVVTASTTGGGLIGAVVLIALGIVDLTNFLPIPTWLYGTATVVASVGGAYVRGRSAQTQVETVTTPLSDPRDIDGRPLVPRPPSEPPAMDPPAYGRRRTFGDPGGY